MDLNSTSNNFQASLEKNSIITNPPSALPLDSEVSLQSRLNQMQERLRQLEAEKLELQASIQTLQRTINQSRNLSFRLFDALPAFLLILDAEGRCITANQNILDLCDYSLEVLQGRTVETLFVNPAEFADCLKIVQKQNNVRDYLLTLRLPGQPGLDTVWSVNLWDDLPAIGNNGEHGYILLGRTISSSDQYILRSADVNRRLALLNLLNDRIRSSLNPQTVLQTIVNELGKALQVDRCILIEFEANAAGQLRPILNYQYSNLELAASHNDLRSLLDQPQVRALFTTAEPVIINNLTEVFGTELFERYPKEYAPPLALMGMPVVAGDQQIAFLGVLFFDIAHEWTQNEVDLLLDVAERSAAAITNARLFAQVEAERVRSTAILASMGEGVVTLDEQGCVVMLNPVAEKMLNVKLSEILGRPADEVLPIKFCQQPTNFQVTLDKQVLAVTTSPLLGTIEHGTVSLLRDITEENRVQQAKNNFMMLVSHELRTPLTAVRGALEILDDEQTGDLNELQSDFLKVAMTNTERLQRLLNTVLDISEVETGRLRLDFSPLLLSDALARALSGKLGEDYAAKSLEMAVDLQAAPSVYADVSRVIQIFEQLLSNACKFTPNGGKVTITSQLEGAEWVRISIADTGVGISPAERSHLGDKFYRVDHSLTREVGGSGLGLAISKSLVELHGGHLELSSTPGQGTTFSFLLPAIQ